MGEGVRKLGIFRVVNERIRVGAAVRDVDSSDLRSNETRVQ